MLAGAAKSRFVLRELHLEACALGATAVKVLSRSAFGERQLYLNLRDSPALRRLAGLSPATHVEGP